MLVIEAGPLDNGSDDILIPGLLGGDDPQANKWQTQSEPQSELGGKVFKDQAGRMVGGGSVVNAMIFLRAHAKDFDSWTAFGNKGWTWNDVLPYYIKARNSISCMLSGPQHPDHVADSINIERDFSSSVRGDSRGRRGHHPVRRICTRLRRPSTSVDSQLPVRRK